MPAVLSLTAQRIITLMIFLFIPLAVVAPHALVWEVVAGGIFGLYYSHKKSLPKLFSPLVIILVSLSLWAMVTSLWAKYPLSSFLSSVKVLALVVSGIYWCRLVSDSPVAFRKLLINSFTAGLFAGLIFLATDRWAGNPWLHFWQKSSAKAFAQGSLMISLAFWPVVLSILNQHELYLRHILLASSLFAVILYILSGIDCDTSCVGLLAGMAVFLTSLWRPRFCARGLRFGVPFFVFCFPFISLYVFKPEYIPSYNHYLHSPSYIDRMYIWNDVASSIVEQPWKGIGMGGTRHHEKAAMVRHWTYEANNGKINSMQTNRFGIHSHNAILELWLELGIIGFIGGIILVYKILAGIGRANLPVRNQAIANALFINMFIIPWVNLGLWQSWWISGAWIIIGLTLMLLKIHSSHIFKQES